MRIIAGSLKGRRLKSPTWEGLRPTSDKLRETLFNILAPRIAGVRLLDLYAGTGAIGLEGLSRGAAHVTFVERDARATRLIKENLTACGITKGYAIIRGIATRAMSELAREPPFDIVVLDPPYADPIVEALERAGDLLASGGVVVLEHARRRPAPAEAGRLIRTREVTAGDSALALYECRL